MFLTEICPSPFLKNVNLDNSRGPVSSVHQNCRIHKFQSIPFTLNESIETEIISIDIEICPINIRLPHRSQQPYWRVLSPGAQGG